MYKTLHIKQKIDLPEIHYKLGVILDVSEGKAVPAQHDTPVILLLLQT